VTSYALNRMREQLSVLSQFQSSHLRIKPYPHLIIPNALEPRIADALRTEFPEPSTLGIDESCSNQRWDYSAALVQTECKVSSLWKDFIDYHVSKEFWLDVIEVFGDSLENCGLDQPENLRNWIVGVRDVDTHDRTDILLDAQISGNSPVQERSSVRGAHVDQGDKLFTGLLYLRDIGDDSDGGDFLFQRWKRGIPHALKPHLYHEDMRMFVETHSTVRYSHNTLVFQLNSLDALHAVTPRSVTNYRRKFANFVGILPNKRYRVPNQNIASKLHRRLIR
jgi:hypothetical protein